MRILMVHTHYREPGGEDVVFETEASLLESYGHDVYREEYSNDAIPDTPSMRDSVRLAIGTAWSGQSHERIRQVITEFQPDVAHFHNTFPQVPPSVYRHCRRAGVAVVQTLHNHRMLCPSATFYREGSTCTECLGRRLAWPGIVHACYRGSRAMTAVSALTHASHRLLGTWARDVDVYIALSQHSRNFFIQGGLPAESLVIKPNFLISDAGVGAHSGDNAIFVGRLADGKGLQTLLEAWENVDPGFRLKIIGDGPLAPMVQRAATHNSNVEWLGRRPQDDVMGLIGDASLLVFPSEWHETFGRTIVEAFSRGTPVLAADLGAPRELVQSGVTGVHFEAGNPKDLAERASCLYQDPDQMRAMGVNARAVYESEFTAERNYHQLMDIYDTAINRCRAGLRNTERVAESGT